MNDKPHILIVDDDESTHRTLALVLGKQGYQTETAATGREAIEKARGRFFNLALLDIWLPDVEGIELLAPLQEMHPDMVVIMVTAYASLKTAVRALNRGASAYITKPLNMDEVLAAVREALAKQRLVLENRRLYEEIQQKVEELELLLDTATAVSSTLEVDRVLHILAEKMGISVEATFCRIALLDETRQALTIRAASPIRGLDWDPGLGRQYALADAPWHRQAIERGEAVVVRQDDPSKAASETECRIALGEGIRSALLIPLMIAGRILGVASLGEMRRWERTPFTAHRVRLCQAMADQAAVAIENSRLYCEADEARRRYQDLYDNAPVMYHTIDTKGIILECNQTEADMLGYSKEEIIGQPIYAFETKEYQDLAPHALREGMEKGYAVGERRFVKKDGTIIDTLLDAQAIYDDSGQVVGFRSTLADITERVRAEEALRESEEQFRQLAENIHEIFWMISPQGQVLYVSPAYEEIWGRTCESLYEQPQSRLNAVHPEDRERVMAAYTAEKLIRGEFDAEYRVERPDGLVRWIRDRGFPIRDERGNVYRIAGIAEDITARKGEELAVAEERSRIAGEIHDAIIQELSSLGLSLDFCIKEVERDTTTVQQELVRIRELLQHNVRELRHVILALRPVALEQQGLVPTLEDCIREWGRRTGIQTHVSVVGQGVEELPLEVQTALFRLTQESLNNVLRHAAAHRVRVTLDMSPPTAISLTVRDDGRGFDVSTTAATSVGLGLRQMHERAEAAGGRLEILATPGEGTEVRVTIPRAGPHEVVNASTSNGSMRHE